MDSELKNIFDKAAKPPSTSEVFAKEPQKDVKIEDVFSGDENLMRVIQNAKGRPSLSHATRHASQTAPSLLTPANILLAINALVIVGFLTYFALYRPTPQTTTAQPSPPQTPESVTPTTPLQAEFPDVPLSVHTAGALDEAASWRLAENLFNEKNYTKAYHVYKKLRENLLPSIPSDEFLRDCLTLKMALCLQNLNQQEDLTNLFTSALESRSPIVRTLANYHLMFSDLHNKQYASARMRAYRTLALAEVMQEPTIT